MTLAITILGGIAAAAVAAVLAHRFTSRRDTANRRSELRIQYLLDAYRTIADTANRPLEEGTDGARAFEQSLADIQLLGSLEQAKMATDIARSIAGDGGAGMDDLLLSLRDELRSELGLEPLAGKPMHMRVIPKGEGGKSEYHA